MTQLGKLEKITDLHEIWKHEQHDFSKWLAEEENLNALSDVVGINIVQPEPESPVGKFRVDIFAAEKGTGRKIVIENQIEETNHKHLGQIITYAAGKSADVVIWIVKRAQDEHRQAIEWLNQRTDTTVGFFLIEIEVLRIGGSLPAVNFKVVERPNKPPRVPSPQSVTKMLQYDFWTAFRHHATNSADFAKEFRCHKPAPKHWYNLGLGSADYYISMAVGTQKKLVSVCIYIPDNKDIYHQFQARQEEVERCLGEPLDWREAKKACRILLRSEGDISDKGNWTSIFNWLCCNALKFKAMVRQIAPQTSS